MTVKRNELEILNKAIELSDIKVHREFERDKVLDEYNYKNNNARFKKDDYKRQNEHELEMIKLDSKIDRFNEEINGFNDQLNLLRWLYKEEV